MSDVRLVQFGDRWVVEEFWGDKVEYRFAYPTEEKAREVYLRKVAARAGTIQAMLFGWNVDGVGELRIDIAPKLQFPILIEPANGFRRSIAEGDWAVYLDTDGPSKMGAL